MPSFDSYTIGHFSKNPTLEAAITRFSANATVGVLNFVKDGVALPQNVPAQLPLSTTRQAN
ncbi:MAG: hypothetical protein ACRDTH_26925 [Pseudonocardiaceae bacterium]